MTEKKKYKYDPASFDSYVHISDHCIILFGFSVLLDDLRGNQHILRCCPGKITIGGHLIENFNNLIANYDLWRAMGNSFVYAIVQVVLAILICSLAGFGFELYHDKGKDLVFSILLLAMMIPQVATMIPLFRLLSSAHLLNRCMGLHPSVYLHTVPDHDVPSELQELPG